MNSWYLIYCKPKQEQVALLNLERQEYEVYLPMRRQRYSRLNQSHWRIEPLFPRYLFIHLNADSDNWGPIRSTRGVVNLVRFGGLPARVPDGLIDYLKAHESERIEAKPIEHFQSGDRVEVTEGVMTSYQGIFQEKIGAKRASILLQIADRYTVIRVPIDSLIKPS